MTEIRLDRVGKSFGGMTVVKDLDLTIHAGEFFTFVGPSGCGKSTLLNLIAGLEPVTSGTILFDGKPVNALTPKERDVAMVFQSYALYPHMTVFGNIAFPLVMQKMPKDTVEAEVHHVARLLGLGELLEKRPKDLSGGQRQRVALGRAIIRKPKVFLMDEPLSNLDARLRIEMRAEIKGLHRRLGITTVYVTHDQAEAVGLSDRLAVLHEGTIQQCDEPRVVYRRPSNTFVAGFIGSPPMNFIAISVTSAEPLKINCLGRQCSSGAMHVPDGARLIAGLRPEDLHARPAPEEDTVEAVVLAAEPAGPLTWVEARQGDAAVRASAGADARFMPGDRVHLRFECRNLVLFDAATGERL
jgi:multiple sugar transport system ATP-binding protein